MRRRDVPPAYGGSKEKNSVHRPYEKGGKRCCRLCRPVLGVQRLLWEDKVAVNHRRTSSACRCDAADGARALAGLAPALVTA